MMGEDRVWEKLEYPEYVEAADLSRFSPNAHKIAGSKYLTRDPDGVVNQTVPQRFYDLARTMAEAEQQYGASPDQVDQHTRAFFDMMVQNQFVPGGRVLTNTRTDIPSLFNCYVLPISDSIRKIFEAVGWAADVHKSGGGTGYNFSPIRPRGTYVSRSKGVASGPVSFIGQFDYETSIINSGNRRGANMGILDIDHPDVLEFIYAKTMEGRFTNFNISVGVYDRFMEAVKGGEHYPLMWAGQPFTAEQAWAIERNILGNKIGGSDVGVAPRPPSLLLKDGIVIDTYKDRPIGRVKSGVVELDARIVMETIEELAWQTGDPGVIFLDRVNANNPFPQIGAIKATNPCGEQPLHPFDACNLGSINLDQMVTSDGTINYDLLERVTRTAVRFMDNVNDVSEGPLPEIEKTVRAHRRIGLGVMGWHDMLLRMRVPYQSGEALQLAREVMGFITDIAKDASVQLALEPGKGTFQPFPGSAYDTGDPKDRVRNVQRTTIAPTGTISTLADVAPGIEPYFAVAYQKNLRGGDVLHFAIPHFRRLAEEEGFYSDGLLERVVENHGSVVGVTEVPREFQELFRTAHDIPVEWHVKMQAAFQARTDNAVSKTINLPRAATVDDVHHAYMLAYEEGAKGITVYRDGSKAVQVLEAGSHVKKVGLENLLTAERPEEVRGRTVKIQTPIGDGLVTFNFAHAPDGLRVPYEVILNVGKGGRDDNAAAEGYGRLISLALKAGVPPAMIGHQLRGIGGGTQTGFGANRLLSLPDAVGKALEKMVEDEGLGESSASEESTKAFSGNCCPDCGSAALVHAEGCEKCSSCAYAKC